jgi:hypothetical protein
MVLALQIRGGGFVRPRESMGAQEMTEQAKYKRFMDPDRGTAKKPHKNCKSAISPL